MNIFKQFIVSLYSPKDIATFRHQGKGKTFLYVLFLTLLFVLPSFYFFNTSIINGTKTLEETIQNELPPFKIENGQLSSEENAPITINKDSFTIVFDSTNTIKQEDTFQKNDTLFFLANEIVYTTAGQTQSLPYSIFGDAVITQKEIGDFFAKMKSILPIAIPLVDVFIYLFSIVMKIIEISFLALFGLIIKNMFGKQIKYGRLWRLSAYSITLPTVFFTIMDALQTVVPSGFFINWFVTIMMLMLVLKEIPSQQEVE